VALIIARRERQTIATEKRDEPQPTPNPPPTPEPLPRHPLTALALAQLDLAIELLQSPAGRSTEHTVHETRKALKRLRALMRLLRVQLGPQEFARENAALRDAGRALAGARDAEIMVSALDDIVGRHPKRLSTSGATARLRSRLLEDREHTETLAIGEHDARALVLDNLREVRQRVSTWQLDTHSEQPVQLGLTRIYREGRQRGRLARRQGSTESLHDWRKRVKDLRYATAMLSRPGRPGRRLRTVTRRADRLGELLGAEHDLALLAERVRQEKSCFDGERATRKDLLRLIARRRKRLHRRALSLGKSLYRRRPRRFTRRVYPPAQA
jgi:CHAD domain-containing protein